MSKENAEPQEQVELDFYDAITQEPCPEWLLKLLERMMRTYAPELKGDDLKSRPWVFEGYSMAGQFALAKAAENLDLSAFPDSEYLQAIEQCYQGEGVLEVCTPAELLAEIKQRHQQIATDQLSELYKQISAAARRPQKEALEFFQAFGDGLKRQMASNAIKRLRDSNTVKICMFVVSCRPYIESGVFRNISELIEVYFYLQMKKGEQLSANDTKRIEAFISQFRRICSAAKLKLRGKGRPRKEQSEDPLSSGK